MKFNRPHYVTRLTVLIRFILMLRRQSRGWSAGAEAPDPTVFLLRQVVLLHPVGCELVGRHSRKSGSMQGLDPEQQHRSRYAGVSQQHGVTSRPTGVTTPVCEER